jgi:excinuclease ABC subunit A
LFSFNSPQGACPACDGLGMHMEFALTSSSLTRALALEGAITVWGPQQLSFMQPILEGLAAQHHIDLRQPFGALTEAQQHAILYGTDGTPVHVQHTTNGRTHTFRRSVRGVIPLLQAALSGH